MNTQEHKIFNTNENIYISDIFPVSDFVNKYTYIRRWLVKLTTIQENIVVPLKYFQKFKF